MSNSNHGSGTGGSGGTGGSTRVYTDGSTHSGGGGASAYAPKSNRMAAQAAEAAQHVMDLESRCAQVQRSLDLASLEIQQLRDEVNRLSEDLAYERRKAEAAHTQTTILTTKFRTAVEIIQSGIAEVDKARDLIEAREEPPRVQQAAAAVASDQPAAEPARPAIEDVHMSSTIVGDTERAIGDLGAKFGADNRPGEWDDQDDRRVPRRT